MVFFLGQNKIVYLTVSAKKQFLSNLLDLYYHLQPFNLFPSGSKGSSCSTKRKLDEAKPVYKSLVDESKGEHSNANGTFSEWTFHNICFLIDYCLFDLIKFYITSKYYRNMRRKFNELLLIMTL